MPGRSSLVKDLQNKGSIFADPTSHTDNLNDVGILIGVDYFFSNF